MNNARAVDVLTAATPSTMAPHEPGDAGLYTIGEVVGYVRFRSAHSAHGGTYYVAKIWPASLAVARLDMVDLLGAGGPADPLPPPPDPPDERGAVAGRRTEPQPDPRQAVSLQRARDLVAGMRDATDRLAALLERGSEPRP